MKGPSADTDFAAVILRAHTASRKERKASNMMHLTWDQQLSGQLNNLVLWLCVGCRCGNTLLWLWCRFLWMWVLQLLIVRKLGVRKP